MSLYNTSRSYGRVAQCLHWLVAILILSMLALGLWMEGLPRETQAEVERVAFYYSLHKTIGIATLAVVVVRILWALVSVRPGLLNADNRLEAFGAAAVHWLLYGAILLMPLSGWLHHAAHSGTAPIWWPPGLGLGQGLPLVPKDHDLSHFFETLHWALSWMIIGAVALHAAGALKHALVDRDGTLSRMLPWRREGVAAPPERQPSHLWPLAAAAALLAAAIAVAVALAGRGADPAPATTAPPGQATAAGQAAQATAAGRAAPSWIVDPQNSRLGIEVQLMGSPVAGSFGSWTADIAFDPEDPAASEVEVTIDLASLALGDVGEQARGPAYLDAAGNPSARFAASAISRTGAGAYEAEGELILRGKTVPVILPFELAIEGDTARMTGRTTVDRMDFGVGADAMPGEDSLAFPVDVIVELTARRAAAE